MTTHDAVGAYALGALSPDEAREFEAHLSTCTDCQAELAALGSVVEELAEPGDGEDSAPPASMRDAVMSRIAVTPQEASPEGDAPVAPTPDADEPDPEPVGSRRFAPRLIAAAAAVVAVAGVGIGVLTMGGTDGQVVADAERIQEAPDVVAQPLGLGEARLYVSDEVGGVAVVGEIPALADGQIYQLWVVPDDGTAPLPGPLLDHGEVVGAWLTDLDGAAAIALSIEPVGGSTSPTDVVAAVDL